ncbi:MAG: hypothetical protein R3D05_00475 [Dongiaceae bacterium]
MLAIAILTGLAASNGTAWAQQGNQPAPDALGPGCHFGEVIDSSTADDACKKIEAVGFTNVHELKKSCDNFWHGRAVLSGHPVRVVLSPAGKVMLESD